MIAKWKQVNHIPQQNVKLLGFFNGTACVLQVSELAHLFEIFMVWPSCTSSWRCEPSHPTGLPAEVLVSQQRDCGHQLLLVQAGGECRLLQLFSEKTGTKMVKSSVSFCSLKRIQVTWPVLILDGISWSRKLMPQCWRNEEVTAEWCRSQSWGRTGDDLPALF